MSKLMTKEPARSVNTLGNDVSATVKKTKQISTDVVQLERVKKAMIEQKEHFRSSSRTTRVQFGVFLSTVRLDGGSGKALRERWMISFLFHS